MMKFQLNEYSIFEAGHRTDAYGNPHQEDCIYPPHGQGDDGLGLFIVCDGMGGHDAGEVASSVVCRSLSDAILSDCRSNDNQFGIAELQRAISYAYEQLDKADTGAAKKMGTTLALLKLSANGYIIAHIGDSRVYHIRPGDTPETTEIIYRTEDHSLVNYLVRIGEMTPEEALVSPKRNVITRAMQPNMERRSKADTYQSEDIRKGDYFLLCSDGILENIDDDYIKYLFSNDGGSAKNKTMLLHKVTGDNNDNHSAIIVQVADITDGATPPQPQKAEKTENTKRQPSKTEDKRAMTTNRPTATTNRESRKTKPAAIIQAGNGDTITLMVKFLFAVIGLLVLIMLVYYLFIRSNEDLQRAGTAIDAPIEGAAGNHDETYGYEITDQDMINVAQEIAPEAPEPTDDITQEDEVEAEAQPAEEAHEPELSEPEPILQE